MEHLPATASTTPQHIHAYTYTHIHKQQGKHWNRIINNTATHQENKKAAESAYREANIEPNKYPQVTHMSQS